MKKSRYILLIEPDRPLARQYIHALEVAGHSVRWATDAQTAISAADKQTPQLIITELQLAGHSGYEFLYEFRSYAEWQKVPVLVLSTVPFEESGLEGGALAELKLSKYLYKSQTTLKKLVSTVDTALAAPAGGAHAR